MFMISKCHPTEHGDFENIFKMFPSVPVVLRVEGDELDIRREQWERVFTYEELAKPAPASLVLLEGFRQSWKYLPRRQLVPTWDYPALDEKYQLGDGTSWFLHVRLGDFRKLPHHFIDLREYYKNALSKIPIGSRVLWASDEPAIYREYLDEVAGRMGLKMIEIEETEELEVLYIFSKCKAGGIGSNSTFSWWAAYFARGGREGEGSWFFPARWGNAHLLAVEEIYASWMTRLDV